LRSISLSDEFPGLRTKAIKILSVYATAKIFSPSRIILVIIRMSMPGALSISEWTVMLIRFLLIYTASVNFGINKLNGLKLLISLITLSLLLLSDVVIHSGKKHFLY
jgi:hypothetical protein